MKKLPLALAIIGIIFLISGSLLASGKVTSLSVLYGPSSTSYVGQPVSVLCYEGFGPQSSTGALINYDITWGDGSPDTFATSQDTQYVFTHTYAIAGNYLAICTVSGTGISGVGDTELIINPAQVTSVITTISTGISTTSTITSTSTSQVTSTNSGITLISGTSTVTVTVSSNGTPTATTTVTFGNGATTTITRYSTETSLKMDGAYMAVFGIIFLGLAYLTNRKVIG